MSLIGIMRSRRSVRRFDPSRVPTDEMMGQLIEAAITAPSPGNRQPWKFRVERERARMERTVEIVRGRSAEIAQALPEAIRPAFSEYASNFSAFASAPVLLVPMYRVHSTLSRAISESADPSLAEALGRVERDSALISVSAAMQNIMLMAHEMGLATCCMTGPLLAADAVHEALDAPRGWNIAALIPVGYADSQHNGPGRKPADTFIIK